MKLIPVALSLALLGVAAAEESCPDELPGKVELDGAGLELHYGILESADALCGKLVSDTDAWVGFGAQPPGTYQMVGAKAVIALPSSNTVEQYILNGMDIGGVVALETQSLTETSVLQENGTTVAKFKQPLSDDGFVFTSSNVYLMAKGFSSEMGYHGSNRGVVELDFEKNIITSPTTTAQPSNHPTLQSLLQSSSETTYQPSPQPSSQFSQKSSTQPTFSTSNDSSEPSLEYTNAPFSGDLLSTIAPTMTLPITASITIYPSLQPSIVPSSRPSSKPSSRPSTQFTPSTISIQSAEPSSLPSAEPSSQILDASHPPSSTSPQPSRNSSSEPSVNVFLNEVSQPASAISIENVSSSSSEKIVSIVLPAACILFGML
jgi:hypothetical protein